MGQKTQTYSKQKICGVIYREEITGLNLSLGVMRARGEQRQKGIDNNQAKHPLGKHPENRSITIDIENLKQATVKQTGVLTVVTILVVSVSLNLLLRRWYMKIRTPCMAVSLLQARQGTWPDW